MTNEFAPLVYQVSSISKLFWKEYLGHFDDAQLMVKVAQSKIFAFPSFTLEVFHRLYYEPYPEKLNPLPPEGEWAIKLHNKFSEVIGFDELVEQCQGNQLAAGLATVEYCRKVYEKLPPPIPRFGNPQQYRDLIRQLKQNAEVHPSRVFQDILNPPQSSNPGALQPKTRQQQEAEQRLKQLIDDSGDDSQEMSQILQRQGKQAVFEAQQYAASLQETQIRQMLRASLASSVQKLAESAEWLEMMGLSWGNDSGQNMQASPDEKLALVQKIAGNDKLKQIALLAGRFRAIADRKRRSKVKDAVGEITTIELGNNLSRLLPGELQKLADPALFPLFALGYYDRSLLQSKTSGKEKRSRGPLIVCLDSSGSMAGLPDTWAKAVTAVLLQIARQDNRSFRVLHFGTRVYRVDDFPPQHQDYSRLLESMLAFYNGGGTNWVAPLKKAIKCIEQQQHYKQADIVMITDGKCELTQEFLEKLQLQKSQLEFTVYGILIGTWGEGKLKQFCDRIWVVKDLMAENAIIEELFLI